MKKMRIVAYGLVIAFVVLLIRPEILGVDGFTKAVYAVLGETGQSVSEHTPTDKEPAQFDSATQGEQQSESNNPSTALTYEGEFELPLNGASAYASVSMDIISEIGENGVIVKTLKPGECFCIEEEVDEIWWKVTYNGQTGYVKSKYCMINLPDVIPSIVYYNSNSSFALFRTSTLDIPDITGEMLYNAAQQNARFGKNTYNMPVLYGMAKKVMAAQRSALVEGYSLKIYETYRPQEIQELVSSKLQEMLEIIGGDVAKAVNNGIWNTGWFISTGVSNHQRGYAMDVSLVMVLASEMKTAGKYQYLEVTDYQELEMPTDMHELSIAAASLKEPVDGNSTTAWQGAPVAGTMTEGAIKLREYCTFAGLTPLASEWWHFSDLGAKADVMNNYSHGAYILAPNCSAVPE